jgi:hypothetical protein
VRVPRGGGRKPKGAIHSKSEVFTTRITAQTRAAIEAEAERSGQSISQVAERLLILGIETRRRRQNNRSLRALCFLIEELAMRISGNKLLKVSSRQENGWRTNPFRYKAFKIAVQSLLEALAPSGEINPPSDKWFEVFGNNPEFAALIKNTYASPENLAAANFEHLWTSLNRVDPLSEGEVEWMRSNWLGELFRDEFYSFRDARDDLQLDSKNKEDAN